MLGWQDDLKVRLTARISIGLRALFPMQTLNRGKSGGDLHDSNEGSACAAAFHLPECGSKSECKHRKEEENLSHGIETWDCKLKLQSCIATSWSLLYLD